MAKPKTKKEESSISRAPKQIMPACFNMEGMAMLPTIDAPVRNLVISTQLCTWKMWKKQFRLANHFYFKLKKKNLVRS
ncbi:hypothetical protein MA16_Dca020295 [Dendrobium catenatum]|uniref:Uncharacterized protein n=1 Tax=Dendrobium catenatum TaxID=906689 RepID=A0A2I0X480_9ASPA|nr:hypothetical protein MA16_Dca020295 [Dendrobium catenatum]